MKYNHWFWNSRFINWLAAKNTWLASFLWRKQYGKDYKNDFWHST